MGSIELSSCLVGDVPCSTSTAVMQNDKGPCLDSNLTMGIGIYVNLINQWSLPAGHPKHQFG